jgi:hypothetical protein
MGVEPQVGPATEGWVLIDIPIMNDVLDGYLNISLFLHQAGKEAMRRCSVG